MLQPSTRTNMHSSPASASAGYKRRCRRCPETSARILARSATDKPMQFIVTRQFHQLDSPALYIRVREPTMRQNCWRSLHATGRSCESPLPRGPCVMACLAYWSIRPCHQMEAMTTKRTRTSEASMTRRNQQVR